MFKCFNVPGLQTAGFTVAFSLVAAMLEINLFHYWELCRTDTRSNEKRLSRRFLFVLERKESVSEMNFKAT